MCVGYQFSCPTMVHCATKSQNRKPSLDAINKIQNKNQMRNLIFYRIVTILG